MEKLWKPYGSVLDLIFHYFIFPFTDIKWNIITQGFQKFYGSPEAIFQQNGGGSYRAARPSELGCFHLKQPKFQNVLEGPRFENFYLHPLVLLNAPSLCFSADFFPKPLETLQVARWCVLSLPEWSTMVPRRNYNLFTPLVLCYSADFFPKPLETLQVPWRWVLTILEWSTMVPGWNYSLFTPSLC